MARYLEYTCLFIQKKDLEISINCFQYRWDVPRVSYRCHGLHHPVVDLGGNPGDVEESHYGLGRETLGVAGYRCAPREGDPLANKKHGIVGYIGNSNMPKNPYTPLPMKFTPGRNRGE